MVSEERSRATEAIKAGGRNENDESPANRPPADSEEGSEQFLVFKLRSQPYGVPILCVKEIQRSSAPTAIPRTPDYLAGVINLRGSVLPVIDLGCLLDRQASEITRRSCIVIVEARAASNADTALEAGIIVDMVDQVVDLAAGDIESTPAVGIGERARFVAGMGRYGEGFAILLDLAMILGPEEIQILADSTREAAEGAAIASEIR